MITALAMMFAVLTSYTRARAESLVAKCKVGFMERPERIVLFMIGAFTNRMAGVLLGDPRPVRPHRRRPDLLHLARARTHQQVTPCGLERCLRDPNEAHARQRAAADDLERALLDPRARHLASTT